VSQQLDLDELNEAPEQDPSGDMTCEHGVDHEVADCSKCIGQEMDELFG